MVSDKINLDMGAPAVRGRARVQMFDADTGDLTSDQAHDNFVSERWLAAMSSFANWAALSTADTGTSINTPFFQADAFNKIPFQGIALTDYDGAPDQDERLVRGIPNGHASKGVAGGGAWRGSYNANESIHEMGYQKFVYDFATSEANGTFQSIYTGNFRSSGTSKAYTSLSPAFLNTTSWKASSTAIVRDDATGILYLCETGAVYEVTDWTPIAYGRAPETTKKADFSPVAKTLSFTVKDGRLYWLTTGSTKYIMSAPLSDLGNTKTEKTLDAAWAQNHDGTSATYTAGLTYHQQRNVFFIATHHTTSSAPSFTLMALDPITFADGDKFGAIGDLEYRSIAAFPGETGLMVEGNNSRTIQLELDGSITVTSLQDYETRPLGAASIALAKTGGSGNKKLAPAQLFFSRALLDDPVTKTVQNTMKITYEFTFDPPSLS